MRRATPKSINKYRRTEHMTKQDVVHVYFATFQIAKKSLDPSQPAQQIGILSRVFHFLVPVLDTQQVRDLEAKLVESIGLSACVCTGVQPLGTYPKAMFEFVDQGGSEPRQEDQDA